MTVEASPPSMSLWALDILDLSLGAASPASVANISIFCLNESLTPSGLEAEAFSSAACWILLSLGSLKIEKYIIHT